MMEWELSYIRMEKITMYSKTINIRYGNKKYVFLWPGSQASIEISYKIKAFGHAHLVRCTKLFHSWGGYFNSLI